MTRMKNATDAPTPPTPPTLFDYANIGPCGDFCAPSSQPLQPVAPRPSAVDQDRVERVLGGAGVGAGIMPCALPVLPLLSLGYYSHSLRSFEANI